MTALQVGTIFSAGALLPPLPINRHRSDRLIAAVRFNPKRNKDIPEVLVEDLTDDDPFVRPGQKDGIAIHMYALYVYSDISAHIYTGI
jgi:hypothetical protein